MRDIKEGSETLMTPLWFLRSDEAPALAINNRNAGSFPDKIVCDSSANTAVSACDQRNLIFELPALLPAFRCRNRFHHILKAGLSVLVLRRESIITILNHLFSFPNIDYDII